MCPVELERNWALRRVACGSSWCCTQRRYNRWDRPARRPSTDSSLQAGVDLLGLQLGEHLVVQVDHLRARQRDVVLAVGPDISRPDVAVALVLDQRALHHRVDRVGRNERGRIEVDTHVRVNQDVVGVVAHVDRAPAEADLQGIDAALRHLRRHRLCRFRRDEPTHVDAPLGGVQADEAVAAVDVADTVQVAGRAGGGSQARHVHHGQLLRRRWCWWRRRAGA